MKTSLPLSPCLMKPWPFSALNNFTIPLGTSALLMMGFETRSVETWAVSRMRGESRLRWWNPRFAPLFLVDPPSGAEDATRWMETKERHNDHKTTRPRWLRRNSFEHCDRAGWSL